MKWQNSSTVRRLPASAWGSAGNESGFDLGLCGPNLRRFGDKSALHHFKLDCKIWHGPGGYNSYTIYRKSKEATNWGEPLMELDGSATNYTDTNVQVGVTYEYQIAKYVSVPDLDDLTYNGFGYIYSGIEAPLIEDRGTLILVVATNSALGLSNELAQLQSDLTGDGWYVIREDVSSNDTPQYVRSLITNDYYADPVDVEAVFLFGHVPILESGYLNYDGHYTRAMPAATYDGEMNDAWTVPTKPTNGPSYIPSDLALEVGRVDMFNMIAASAPVEVRGPARQALLQNYLNKDHNWRTHQIQVQRQSLMGDRRGDVDGTLGMAASGYRNFTPFVGASDPLYGTNDIIEANIQDDASRFPQRWIYDAGQGLITSGPLATAAANLTAAPTSAPIARVQRGLKHGHCWQPT